MTTITNPQHAITLGGLSLVAAGKPVTHAGGFTTEVSADGTNWGNPEVVVAQIISMLTDGDMVAQTHVGNRQVPLHVRISASTSAGLTAGEKALTDVVGKAVELVWQPPDSLAPPTVFDVLHSSMDFAFDDLAELRRERAYVLTLTALPWGRSASSVTTAAVTAVAPTVIDSGSATTNWSITRPSSGTTLSVSSGAVRSSYNAATLQDGFYGTTLHRTATISTATDKYIAFDWKTSLAVYHEAAFNGAFGNVEVRREPAPATGYTRSWYKVADSITSLSSVSFSVIHSAGTGTATLDIDQIVRANALPATGTARQLSRTIDPNGSVPAEGDVTVQHATAGLGQTIVYTHPAGGGYSPPLRQWRFSSDTVSADTTTVSGATNLITAATDYRVPESAIPRGDTQLWARLYSNTAGAITIFWAADSWMNGVKVGDGQGGATYVTWATLNTYVLVPLARLTLPTASVGPSGYHRISIQRDAGSAALVFVDEAWLFAMDQGRLTVVDCGTGTPATGSIQNRLRVTAPSLADPLGRIEVATAADWSDRHTPPAAKVFSDQVGHRFNPDGSTIFTVTSGATDAAVSLAHYPRWHSNAGTV